MPETAMLLVAAATLITSAVVPFLSVYFAQRLVRQDTLRQAARDAFLRVSKDIQDYRVAFLAHYLNVLHKPSDLLQSAHELQRMVTMLNGDCLLLGLIFDRKADPLGSRIQQLVVTAQLLLSDKPPPPFDKCQEGLNRDIQAILQETEPLWDSLVGRPRASSKRHNKPVEKRLSDTEPPPFSIQNG